MTTTDLHSLWSLVLDHHDLSPVAADETVHGGDDTASHLAQLLVHHRLLERTYQSLAGTTSAHPKRTAVAAASTKQLAAFLARFQSTVNTLLAASKSAAARLLGMLLAQIWLEQVPELVRDVTLALSWTNALVTIVSRTVDPIPLRTHAATLLTSLIATAARFPDSSRDVAAPTVAKLAPVLVRWTDPKPSSAAQLQRMGLVCISRLAQCSPTSLRPFAHQAHTNALALVYSPSLHALAARTVARLVGLATKTDGPSAFTHLVAQSLATAHLALDVLLAPLDEDDPALPAMVRDAGSLAGTPSLPAADPTLSPPAARKAAHVLECATGLLAYLLPTRLPTANVTLPVAAVLATLARLLSAGTLSPLPASPAVSAALASAQLPLLCTTSLRNLLVPLVRASSEAGALASLAPHATTLGALLVRALHMRGSVRHVALEVLASGAAQVLPADTLVKCLGTPETQADLAREYTAALAAVEAAVRAHGARLPTHVRSAWDQVLVPQTLLQGRRAARVARVSAVVPSLVASAGVPAYSTLALVGYAARGGHDVCLDAVVRPRRAVDAQPVAVGKDNKGHVAGGVVTAEAAAAEDSRFVDPAQVAAQMVDGTQEQEQVEQEPTDDEASMSVETVTETEPVRAVVAPAPSMAPAMPTMAPAPLPPKPAAVIESMQVDGEKQARESEEEEDEDEDLMQGIEIVDSGPDSDEE